jgi:D-beta-D-heptose 7-phosphate kinase/D-beta-D-heptose 1-phosphate adenosyltransferase
MHHIGETPTSCKQRNAIDPTGCGDMVLAALGVCIAAGLTWPDVCQIANAAAGLKCERRGAVPVPRAEVVLDLLDGEKRIQRALLPVVRATRQRVVFTNGCFRVCHAGHAWLMRWAKEQGACLVVGVNDDESAANLRPGEYVMPLAERMEIIAGLGCVDYVVPFSEPDPCELLRLLKPDVLVKGGEYAGERIPGDDMVADVRIAPESPYATHATSLIADLIQNQD